MNNDNKKTKKQINKKDIKKVDKKAIKNVMGGLLDIANEERKETDNYKQLASLKDLGQVVDIANDQIMNIILNLTTVLKEKHGFNNIPNSLYSYLLLLPYTFYVTEKHFINTEGSALSVDKTYTSIVQEIKNMKNKTDEEIKEYLKKQMQK